MRRRRTQPKLPQAIALDPRDNVASTLVDLTRGMRVHVAIGNRTVSLTVRQRIPIGHKIALRPVKKGGWIKKHGQKIGRATRSIAEGDHVHIHNLGSAKQSTSRSRRRQR